MENIDELITRADVAICYEHRNEVLARFVAEGIHPEIAYLAVCAAEVV